MKTLSILAALGIGFAAGWFAKPSPEHIETQEIVSVEKRHSGSSRESFVKSQISMHDRESSRSGEAQAQDRSIAQSSQDTMSDHYGPQLQEYGDQRIQELVETLNLSAEQILALEEALKSGVEDLANHESSHQFLMEDPLESPLAEILSDEQQAEYGKHKKDKLLSKARKQALQQIADLSLLNLDPEKEEEIYQHLFETSESALKNLSPEKKSVSFMLALMGIDEEQLGFNTVDSFADEQDPETEIDLRGQIMKDIDQRIELLAPVLNEDQLDRYRKELLRKNSFMLQAFGNIDTASE